MVPVLIESVVELPFLLGVTVEDPNVTDPVPVGSGPSTLRDTGFPKLVFLFGEFWSVRLNWTVSPTFVASSADASDVRAKSRLTVPTWIGNGVYLVVRYGAPAWPLIHRA